MSEYGGLPTNGVGAGMKNDAFADAVQRARQVSAGEMGLGNTGDAAASSAVTRDGGCGLPASQLVSR